MTEEKTVVQNEATPLEEGGLEAVEEQNTSICRDITEAIFDRVMNWHPLRDAAERAGKMLVAKMESETFFQDQYELTQKQAEFIKAHIISIMQEAAIAAVNDIKNFEDKKEDHVGRVVITEMIRISEITMRSIGQSINRGAVLAMQAVQAKATNDDRDEIVMWKSKETGDITIPVRGVFISTNCIEKIKEDINFLDLKDVSARVL